MHINADQRGRYVEHRLHVKAFLRKAGIIRHRAADVARADDNDMVFVVQAQNFADALLQIGHMIPVSLLAKAAEAVDILPDLRGGQVHALAQLLGGNAHNARLFKLTQMAVIHRQPTHHSVRNP